MLPADDNHLDNNDDLLCPREEHGGSVTLSAVIREILYSAGASSPRSSICFSACASSRLLRGGKSPYFCCCCHSSRPHRIRASLSCDCWNETRAHARQIETLPLLSLQHKTRALVSRMCHPIDLGGLMERATARRTEAAARHRVGSNTFGEKQQEFIDGSKFPVDKGGKYGSI